MPRRPETTWDMLNIAMSHFQTHIRQKQNKYFLSIIDLLHVSNFKGGNASITEHQDGLLEKLPLYVNLLQEIGMNFEGRNLSSLSTSEMTILKKLCSNFLDLTTKNNTKIRGFGPSYASALLAAHFLDLIPVLDRRVLNGAEIVVELDSQKQVKNIKDHYPELIDAFQKKMKDSKKSLREIDKEWFSKNLP